ncbi:hypothetical protein K443DRAFT_481642 [Laccaria amethystina LaAM-08-1]|uniref:Uncharacterized protein n=1 Tax=Laccaria amethystina LaAM-08-1 TaxID=1095629 RepID=A0A0C9Y5R9_9AGAR|nr:hypothetical protein K443DRAFT_481642 [Laccaria amethystina LaAM-08-1]
MSQLCCVLSRLTLFHDYAKLLVKALHTYINKWPGTTRKYCCDAIRRRNLNEECGGPISVVITLNQVKSDISVRTMCWVRLLRLYPVHRCRAPQFPLSSLCHLTRSYSSERSFLHPSFCRCCPMC